MTWKQQDGWNKPGDRSHRRPRDRGRPAVPARDDPGELSTWEASKKKSEKRRRRRAAAWIITGALVVLFLLAGLAPTIAAVFAPGFISARVSDAIAGRVEVGSVRLGWFGGQRVEDVRIFDDKGEQRGELTTKIDKGLLGLLFAGGDYGTIAVSGKIDASADADGGTFLEHIIGPGKSGPGSPGGAGTGRTGSSPSAGKPAIPPGLRATLRFNTLRVTYRTPAAPRAVRIDDLRGDVLFGGTDPSEIDLYADVQLQRPGAALFDDAGTLRVAATIRDLLNPDGTVNTAGLRIRGAIEADRINPDLLDILPDLAGRGVAALGPAVTAAVTAEGPLDALAVNIAVESEALNADAPVSLDLILGSLRSAGPITVNLDTGRLSVLLPDRDALLGPDADVHVTGYPRLGITVENLSLPIPPGDTADLRGAGAVLRAEIGALTADVRTPGSDTRRRVGFEPTTVTVDAPDLASAVAVRTDLNTRADGAASGTLHIDLTASGLLDASGAISASSPPVIRGEVEARQLVLAAFQPIAAAAGFDLTGVIGGTADLTLTASPADGDGTGGSHATDLRLDARADHASASGAVRLDRASLRTTGDGITARFDRLAPLLADALSASGVDLKRVSGVTISIPELAVDLDAAGRGDLSSVRLVADAELERFEGVLAGSGDRVGVRALTLRAEAEPLALGVRVRTSGGLLLNGTDAGRLDADLAADGLLNDSGTPTGGLPARLNGSAELTGVRTAALQPLFDSTGLELENDIGPVLDVTLTAETSDTAAPRGPVTTVTLTAKADRLDAGGSFRLTPDRVVADTLRLDLDRIDGPLARFARLPEGTRLGGGPVAAVRVEDLSLPLDPTTRRPDPARASGTIRSTIEHLSITAAEGEPTSIPSVAWTATLQPGVDPVVSIDGDVRTGEKSGTIRGEFTVPNAFTPFDDGGRFVAAPVGTLTLRRIPARVLALAGVRLERPGTGEVALDDFVINASGGWLSASITTSTGDRGMIRAEASLTTPRHRAAFTADLAPAAGGGFAVRAVEGDADLKLSQPTARHVLMLLLPQKKALVEIPEPGRLTVRLATDKDDTLRGTVTLEPVTVGGIILDNGDRLDRVRLAADSAFAVPLAALTDRDAAHAVSFSADVRADRDGEALLALEATADAALRALQPAGALRADVRFTSADTALLDAFAGAGGRLAGALGGRVGVKAKIETPDPASPRDFDAEIRVDAPLLKTRSPVRVRRTGGAVALTAPAEIRWRLTTKMFDTLAPAGEGKAAQLRLADGIWWTLKADEMRYDPEGGGITLRSSIDAPKVLLRFPDGSKQTWTDLHATLNTLDRPGSARLRLAAIDPDRPEVEAVRLNTAVLGLPDGGEGWTPRDIVLTGEFELDGFPVRLLDALALGQGDLVDLLGPALDLDAHIKNMPRRGGTFTLDAETAQAGSKIRATVRPHPADPGLLAVTLDEPMHTELTDFTYNIKGKKIALLPVFARIVKEKQSDRPTTIDIDRLALPVDGDVAMILLDGRVDPGVVEYEFEQGLALLLDLTQLGTQGKAGERIKPFTIAMRDGVASFDNLAVPIGEFTVLARGRIDLVNKREDIVLGVPAGAFAEEIIGKLPGAGGAINEDVIVPVRRSGPLGQKNPWRPDFEAVLGSLFENLLRGGLEQLFKPEKD